MTWPEAVVAIAFLVCAAIVICVFLWALKHRVEEDTKQMALEKERSDEV